MLEGTNVCKNFGGLRALSEVDFTVEQGSITGLIGPNGSGKSTLFNVISGFYKPEAGRIRFEGQDITGRQPHEIARLGIGRTFQIVRPFDEMTAVENVEVGVMYGRAGLYGAAARRRAEEILDFAGLSHIRDTETHNFILAQKKRLELARALSVDPEMLLLDEVFAGLNPVEVEEAIQLLFRIRDELGVTIFIVEHVMKALMGTCDRVIVLSFGKKIAAGAPAQVAADPEVINVYLGAAHAQN